MAVEPGLARVQYASVLEPMPGQPELQRDMVAWEVLFAKPPQNARFFYGPKDFDVLAGVDRTLVKAIHFGIWDFLAVPLLRALKWIYGYIGNYGWSIIILTMLINMVMFPLRHKSVVSMRRMQELQPQIKAIQDRYAKLKATDPERQKMNTELMALYKEKGVNPASGCVPMLLTMPVLFAFYSLLSVAIEMRGAPFALWIRDLSAHDPYYITPLIMGATMFWQQRLTPVADPGAGEGDDADAHHVPVLLPVGAERAGHLLDRQQPARHRTAVRHEPHHRRAGREAGAPAGRAPAEERRCGPVRRRTESLRRRMTADIRERSRHVSPGPDAPPWGCRSRRW